MEENEIKPSFTGRYILLTIITSAIIAGVTYGIGTIYKSKPVREIAVYESRIANLIESGSSANSQIEATYYLSGAPKKKLKSLFRKTVTIKNIGNEGVENLSVTFSVKEAGAYLVSSPNITSSPESILDAINPSKLAKSSTDKKHQWNIPLLNQNESLTFEYYIYSEQALDKVSFSAVPRKKDWKIIREDILSKEAPKEPLLSFLGGMLTLGFLLPMGLLLFVRLMRPVYKKEWDRNPEIRERYGSYNKYFYYHFPPPILKYFE